MISSIAEPVRELIFDALIETVVLPSRVFKADAETDVSESVTASFPRPEMDPLPLAV